MTSSSEAREPFPNLLPKTQGLLITSSDDVISMFPPLTIDSEVDILERCVR